MHTTDLCTRIRPILKPLRVICCEFFKLGKEGGVGDMPFIANDSIFHNVGWKRAFFDQIAEIIVEAVEVEHIFPICHTFPSIGFTSYYMI